MSPYSYGGGYAVVSPGLSRIDLLMLGVIAYGAYSVLKNRVSVGRGAGWRLGVKASSRCTPVEFRGGVWVHDTPQPTARPPSLVSPAFVAHHSSSFSWVLSSQVSGSQWDLSDSAPPSSLGSGVTVLKLQIGLQVCTGMLGSEEGTDWTQELARGERKKPSGGVWERVATVWEMTVRSIGRHE